MKRIVLALLLVAAPSIFANSPGSKVTATVSPDPGVMPANEIEATLQVTNGYDEPVMVTFEPYDVPGLMLSVQPDVLDLQPGASVAVQVTGEAWAVRKFAVFLKGAVQNYEGVAYPPASMPFHMEVTASNGRTRSLMAVLGDYESLFVNIAETFRVPGLGVCYLASSGIPRGPVAPDPVEPQRESDDAAGANAGEAQTLRGGGVQTDGFLTDVTGVFRWVALDGTVRKAWGWRADLAAEVNGKWVKTGNTDFVGTDGVFFIPNANLEPGVQYRVLISLSNAYFTTGSKDDSIYQLALPVFYAVSFASTHDYGSHYWDLQKGAAAGLGELHLAAWDLYTELEAVDYSPVRDKPIAIIFPSSDPCGACSQNFKIQLAAGRADSHTVRHELGHELMMEKWNAMPAGSGIFHIWSTCYNPGLALAEGFAHFISWWSTVNRAATSGTWGTGFNGEFMPESVCKGIERNELRVAATFWDLHDTRVDGVDTYAYGGASRTLRMILTGGKVDSMTQLLPRLKSSGGPDASKIEPILEANFTN